MRGVVSRLIMVLQPMRLRYSLVTTSTNESRSVDIVRHAPHSFNCRWGHARSRSVTEVGLPRLSKCTLRRHYRDYFRIRHRKEEQRRTVQFDGLLHTPSNLSFATDNPDCNVTDTNHKGDIHSQAFAYDRVLATSYGERTHLHACAIYQETLELCFTTVTVLQYYLIDQMYVLSTPRQNIFK
ncbi:unnamed protein product [Ixodes pacificus]